MKHIRYYIMALLALPLMASCGEDDYSAPTPAGNPVMSYTAPAAAVWMGDEVEVKVNCKDDGGVALSTLKANLLFSGQSVDETTIRTKEAGEYTVKLKVPYAQNVPDGKVDIQLTLQNVSTKSNTETLSFDIKRPHFNNLQFVSADGVKYDMTEKSDFVYQAVLPSSKKTFKGYFATKDGKFVFGSSTGKDISLGETGNFNFTSENMSDVVVTFDAKNYTAGPTDVLPVTILDLPILMQARLGWVISSKVLPVTLLSTAIICQMTGIMTATGSRKKRMEAILSRLLPADILFGRLHP